MDVQRQRQIIASTSGASALRESHETLKREPGQVVVYFPVVLQLQSVAHLLPVCGGFAVHQVNGVYALVCG